MLKAMVLAAGKGTRLFPLTGEVPKPLVTVANVPIIGHIFELLTTHGIGEAYVNVHYLADALLKACGEEACINGMGVRLSREERLMGTAGGVKRLAEHFDETFVVVSGDALTDIDLKDLVAFHEEKGALATMALKGVHDTSGFGVVEVDEGGNVLSFQEKPDPKEAISTLANTGIYVLEPRALEYIPENTFFDFAKDVFPRLLEAKERLVGYRGDFYWSDVGTLGAYRRAQHDVLSGKVRVKVPGRQRGEGVWVGENVRIDPTVRIEGHAVVGRDAVIGRNVLLSGPVAVGSDCWIHPSATLSSCVLLPGASVGRDAHLEDCVVGQGYNVRTGERIGGAVLVRRPPPRKPPP